MAGLQVCIIHYGTRDKSIVNTKEYALKLVAGLQRVINVLTNKDTKFVTEDAFKRGDPDNTWMHFSLITDDVVAVIASPSVQFNAHVLIKYITDTNEFAGGLVAGSGQLPPGGE
jgi:hypothetical protein